MKLTVVLAVLIGMFVLACSSAAPAPAEPTPNIDATVEAKLSQERAVDATVEARLKEERASQPTSIPSPTDTQAPMPTYTPHPTYTPEPTPYQSPTLVPTATHTPTPTPTPTPAPLTKFEGGFVMLLSTGFNISGDIQFKIGGYVASQTMSYSNSSEMILLDLYADSSQSKVTIDSFPKSEVGRRSESMVPTVIAGRAYIDGNYAPDGTVVTAWTNGEEIVETRTTVVNNPTPLAEPKLLSILQTEIPPPFPLPTPCPTYKNNCDVPYYSGRLADDIKAIWQQGTGQFSGNREEGLEWWFYSPDPAWELAHNLPPDMCNYFETDPYSIPFGGSLNYSEANWPDRIWQFSDTCGFGTWLLQNNSAALNPCYHLIAGPNRLDALRRMAAEEQGRLEEQGLDNDVWCQGSLTWPVSR